jgi:hypothetical protein
LPAARASFLPKSAVVNREGWLHSKFKGDWIFVECRQVEVVLVGGAENASTVVDDMQNNATIRR